ncbi:hypothetical protein Taro_039341, partial [Colocasia esculenta]|nr:hypothetical protein [Colocasia esculenta]
VCGFPARFVHVPQFAVVAVPRAWRVWSLGMFMSWLREPACGVAFTGAGLSVELVEVGICWLVVSSSEVLPESFSVGSGGKLFVVVLNGALVVLVEVLPGPACIASAVLLAAVIALLSLLVEVLPKSALCSFLAIVVLPLWFEVCLLVGLRSSESAWVLSVEVLCPWPCVWLLCWPACLVSRFQVSRLCWWDCVSPWLEWLASFLALCVLSQMVVCGRDSLCVSPSSAFRWLLGVVMLHCGVVSPGCALLRPFGGVIFP